MGKEKKQLFQAKLGKEWQGQLSVCAGHKAEPLEGRQGLQIPPGTPLAPILQPPGAEQPPAAHSYETTAAKTGTQQLRNTQNWLFKKQKEKKSTRPAISAMLLEPEPTRRAILLPDPSGFVRSRGAFPHSTALPTLGQPRVLPHWWGDQNQGSKYKNTTAPPPAGVKKRKE